MSIGSSRSRSSSRTSSIAIESGQQVEDQASAFNFAGVITGKKNQAHINVSTSDYGSIQGALQFADGVSIDAFQSAENALEFGAGAIAATLDTLNDSRTDALEFSAGAMVASLEAAEESAERAAAISARAIASAQASAAASMRESTAARRDALEFGAGAFSAALNSVDSAALLAIDNSASAYDSSIEQIGGFAYEAISTVSESVRSDTSKALDLVVKVSVAAAVVGGIIYFMKGK